MKKMIKGMLLIGFLASVGAKASILQTIYKLFERPSLLSFLTTGSNFQSEPIKEQGQPIPVESTPKLPHDYVRTTDLREIYINKLPSKIKDIVANVVTRMPAGMPAKLFAEMSSDNFEQTVDSKINNFIDMVVPYMTQEEKLEICRMMIDNGEILAHARFNPEAELLAFEVDKNDNTVLNIIVNLPGQEKEKRVRLYDLNDTEKNMVFSTLFGEKLVKLAGLMNCDQCINDFLIEDIEKN